MNMISNRNNAARESAQRRSATKLQPNCVPPDSTRRTQRFSQRSQRNSPLRSSASSALKIFAELIEARREHCKENRAEAFRKLAALILTFWFSPGGRTKTCSTLPCYHPTSLQSEKIFSTRFKAGFSFLCPTFPCQSPCETGRATDSGRGIFGRGMGCGFAALSLCAFALKPARPTPMTP